MIEYYPKFTDKAVEFLAQEHSQPFFHYVAYPSPHTPWLPTGEFVGRSGVGSHGDFVMIVDHQVGRILEQLDALKPSIIAALAAFSDTP